MKRLLPPFLFLICVLIMILLAFLNREGRFILMPYNLLGLPLAFLGICLAIVGSRMFQKVKTNIMTFNRPDKLVTWGLFRYSRNPMYLGFVLCLFGIAVVLGGPAGFGVIFLFVVIVDRWYVQFEERMMTKVFGDLYLDYCKKVRRWI